MKYNPNYHHRRSIRLQHYDYSQSGIYFVTLCTHQKQCLFGEIKQGKMIFNQINQIREYIINNPQKWDQDPEKPDNRSQELLIDLVF